MGAQTLNFCEMGCGFVKNAWGCDSRHRKYVAFLIHCISLRIRWDASLAILTGRGIKALHLNLLHSEEYDVTGQQAITSGFRTDQPSSVQTSDTNQNSIMVLTPLNTDPCRGDLAFGQSQGRGFCVFGSVVQPFSKVWVRVSLTCRNLVRLSIFRPNTSLT